MQMCKSRYARRFQQRAAAVTLETLKERGYQSLYLSAQSPHRHEPLACPSLSDDSVSIHDTIATTTTTATTFHNTFNTSLTPFCSLKL